jgi:hypothetical protein
MALSKEVAAVRIQALTRGFLSRRAFNIGWMLLYRRLQQSTAPPIPVRRLDPWSAKCLLLLQRVGRGAIERSDLRLSHAFQSHKTKSLIATGPPLVPHGTRYTLKSTAAATSSSSAVPVLRRRRLPVGYTPCRNAEDFQRRYKAVIRHTQVRCALLIQRWWRRCWCRRQQLEHQLCLHQLISINTAAVTLQRWWRSFFYGELPYDNSIQHGAQQAARAIVKAEELAIHREQQKADLVRLWHSTIPSCKARQLHRSRAEQQTSKLSSGELMQQSQHDGVDDLRTPTAMGEGSIAVVKPNWFGASARSWTPATPSRSPMARGEARRAAPQGADEAVGRSSTQNAIVALLTGGGSAPSASCGGGREAMDASWSTNSAPTMNTSSVSHRKKQLHAAVADGRRKFLAPVASRYQRAEDLAAKQGRAAWSLSSS